MRDIHNEHTAHMLEKTEKMLQYHKSLDEANTIGKEKANYDALMESAFRSNGAAIKHQKEAIAEHARRVSYKDHFLTEALTVLVSDLVEESLLLNTEEYAKMNPNYKDEIIKTVKTCLENADINTDITNENTVAILEAVNANMPQATQYLTEEDEQAFVREVVMSDNKVKSALENLSRDVKARVANIVSNDQEMLAKEQKAIDAINNRELKVAGEVAPVSVQVPDQEPVVQESLRLVPELKVNGIVETLALNEAMDMVEVEKPVNTTLAIANAIKFVTCLEAIDSTGLADVGKDMYAKIRDDASKKASEKEPVKEIEDKKESDIKSKLSKIIDGTIPEGLAKTNHTFIPFAQWKANRGESANEMKVDEVGAAEAAVVGDYKDIHGKVYTEAALYEYFEKQGFHDLDEYQLEELADSWNFKKIH